VVVSVSVVVAVSVVGLALLVVGTGFVVARMSAGVLAFTAVVVILFVGVTLVSGLAVVVCG